MKTVQILPGITTSALGFGCAPILGAVNAETSATALKVATDAGVTHFDLARSYGYGKAERFVGDFLKTRRSEVTISTKFGIETTFLGSALSPLKPLVRSLKKMRGRPGGQKSTVTSTPGANGISGVFHRRTELTPETMRRSFEKSLREMRTDYTDFLFIHEPWETVARMEDLIEQAGRFKQEGKIRAFGVAYMQSQKELHRGYLDGIDIHQFDNSPGMPGYDALVRDRGVLPNIFFSPFRSKRPDESPAEILGELSRDFPSSITLCSMFKPAHIRSNAAAYAVSPGQ